MTALEYSRIHLWRLRFVTQHTIRYFNKKKTMYIRTKKFQHIIGSCSSPQPSEVVFISNRSDNLRIITFRILLKHYLDIWRLMVISCSISYTTKPLQYECSTDRPQSSRDLLVLLFSHSI